MSTVSDPVIRKHIISKPSKVIISQSSAELNTKWQWKNGMNLACKKSRHFIELPDYSMLNSEYKMRKMKKFRHGIKSTCKTDTKPNTKCYVSPICRRVTKRNKNREAIVGRRYGVYIFANEMKFSEWWQKHILNDIATVSGGCRFWL